MCRVLGVLAFWLMCGSALASEHTQLLAHYGQSFRRCTDTVEQNRKVVPAVRKSLLGLCYASSFAHSVAEDSDLVDLKLKAALTIGPEYAEDLFKHAVKAGMDAEQAFASVLANAPRQRTQVVELAIASGADPSRILSATAAGRRR